MTNQTLGQLIRARRRDRKWTQDDLGEALGVSKASVCGWEKGKFRPRDVRLVSRVLSISIDDLVR